MATKRKRMATRRKSMRFLALGAIAILIMSILPAAIADHENEHEQENHQENQEQEYEDWDLSDDFTTQKTTTQEPVVEQVIVTETIPDPKTEAMLKEVMSENEQLVAQLEAERTRRQTLERRIKDLQTKIDELLTQQDLTPFADDDGDGVMNSQDQYPGEDDRLMNDSDGDGISDAEDLFPGEDDALYADVDNDGVRDAVDSDVTKSTDQDHDGIDDAYDTSDDRPFMVKLLGVIGIKE